MKSAVEQLSTYKSVHLNPTNIKTHFIGVPLIIWSAFVMLNTIPITFLKLTEPTLVLNVAGLCAVGVLIYYFKLHVRLALGLTLFIIPVLFSSYYVAQIEAAWIIALSVFVIGWVFQLIGHKYEKAKPAFIDDLNQLLIGPFFLMAELYFMMGFEQDLNQEITPLAVAKRRELEKGAPTA
ncbi:DUF962 domain-containing protein [Shewanella algidipiscicola]|uniref:DUF962 domain-containing protein n=1 Tax=Shewanella algidipiscicola TaxID=614070 RepID=A0ABQ4PAC0_9GAMM|nr:Mpo1-like protein [Shewanella algidipiscicola]GIU44096.1 hypothetical protein TUM4630_08950 [Shewanella algidipiscicola]